MEHTERVFEARMPPRRGFTLTEVLVTLTVFSILIPPALMLSLHLGGRATGGARHNAAIAEARYIQQFFVRTVNASKDPGIFDNGNKISFKLYDSDEDVWGDAMLCFSESEQTLVYYPLSTNGTFGTQTVVASHVYRNKDREVFSPAGNGIRCDLYVGLKPPAVEGKVDGVYGAPGSFIDLTATPRNSGRIQ